MGYSTMGSDTVALHLSYLCRLLHNARNVQRFAPNPDFVFLITAVSGAARPPEIPIRSPSDHPIEASILKPLLASPILGAACVKMTVLLTGPFHLITHEHTLPTSSPSLCLGMAVVCLPLPPPGLFELAAP